MWVGVKSCISSVIFCQVEREGATLAEDCIKAWGKQKTGNRTENRAKLYGFGRRRKTRGKLQYKARQVLTQDEMTISEVRPEVKQEVTINKISFAVKEQSYY